MNTHWTDRLSEYIDDELTPDERRACEDHLAACAACRETVAELRAVQASAQADPDQRPQVDLWPGIAARLAPAASGHTLPFAPGTRQIAFTIPQLALAASLLIAVSAGVAYVAGNRAILGGPAVREDPIQAQAEPIRPPSAEVVQASSANFADAQFDQAVNDLEQILADRRDELDPRTVVIIERNLAAIDQAIREARAALDADPANTFLNSYLTDARRKKLDLLRRAAMISSSGD